MPEREGSNETSPQKAISASRRWRCGAAGRVAHCIGGNLSDAASAHHLAAANERHHPSVGDLVFLSVAGGSARLESLFPQERSRFCFRGGISEPTAAKTRWEMPESIQEANVLGENADTIDLEIVFA